VWILKRIIPYRIQVIIRPFSTGLATLVSVVCAGRRAYRSSSPLIVLIAEVLATSCGYHMSEDVIKLLERDADFLAALQWLVLICARSNHHQNKRGSLPRSRNQRREP
jgi:hypothetical protein